MKDELTLEKVMKKPCYSGYNRNQITVKFQLLNDMTYYEIAGDGKYGSGPNTLTALKMLTIKTEELYSIPCKSVAASMNQEYYPDGNTYDMVRFTAFLNIKDEDELYEHLRQKLIKRLKSKLYEGAVLDSYDLKLREDLGIDPCKGGNSCGVSIGNSNNGEKLTVGMMLKRYCVVPGQDSIIVRAAGCNYIFDKCGYSGVLTEFGDVIKRFSLDDIGDLEVTDGIYEMSICGGGRGKTIRLGTNISSVNELLDAISKARKKYSGTDFVGTIFDAGRK